MSPATVDTTPAPSAAESVTDDEFDLDVRIADAGPLIPELLRSTSDNCGGTCASACTSCRS